MKGIQFKLIRISRKISAKRIAKQLGYISKTPVLDAEKLETMPEVFVKVLESLAHIELSNESQVEERAIASAKKFIKLDKRSTIWISEYCDYLTNVISDN